MSKLCTVCAGIFCGVKTINHGDIHGRDRHTTNDGFALGDSDSDSNIEGGGGTNKRRKVRSVHHHYPNFLEFERSAEQGCHLCKLLLAQLSADDINRLREYALLVAIKGRYRAQMWYSLWPSGDAPAHIDHDNPPYDLQVTARCVRPDVSRLLQGAPPKVACKTSKLCMSVVLERTQAGPDMTLISSCTPLPTFTADSACFELMERWVSNCDAHHGKCRLSRDTSWLPTRLIDVGDDDDNIRLCLSRSLPAGTQYISLSHCWGKTQIIRCLTANIGQLMHLVPFSSLSNTFRDAIHITRRLGSKLNIRHVWIDSLCIVQDSPDDWLVEASRMGDVYGNAWCNIAATASTDGPGGCFRTRDPILPLPVTIPSPTWASLPQGPYHAFDVDNMKRSVSHAPLNTRGWVVQERLLSPRIIHFAADQIYWECLTQDASEAFPSGMPRQVVGRFKDLDPFSAGQDARRGQGLEASDAVANTLAVWAKIVRLYTSCGLTVPADKMVAVSALARRVQTQLGPEVRYVAGMWDRFSASQLFWQVSGAASRPEKYRAPSWSWISVDGEVGISDVHQLNQREIVLEVLEMKVTVAGPDEFVGPVTDGILTVRGMLIRATARYDQQTEEASLVVNGNEVDWWVAWDVEFGGNGRERDVYCLPLRKSHYGNSYDGLLLVPADPLRGGVYKRWGYFSAFQLGDGEFERADRLNEGKYLESHGAARYTISIV
ncbi:heterokaryon incompatibility protein-domain-containing protein [Podospora aff. communis PSN243]|uniref:Heterokaryon incompatibility protein-domain-containing protein n=1 Tax=Podospora aff. communis PSN243 TaxID=3040156 RepID=A0AAV9G1X6_9PEZI|nr:heterokaryon incompatibility protein-domain-containing protein [Podospora aff. communis PSN243]